MQMTSANANTNTNSNPNFTQNSISSSTSTISSCSSTTASSSSLATTLRNCAQRRAQLFAAMLPNSIAIIPAARECVRTNDVNYPYRQASNFHYLTAFPESEAIAVLVPGRAAGEYILFNRTHDALQETWTGKRAGQDGAVAFYGANEAFPLAHAETLIPELMLGKQHLYYDLGYDAAFDTRLATWLNGSRSKARLGFNAPDNIICLGKIVHEMRLRKSAHEIALMCHSANIAVNAHLRAMRFCQPGVMEYQVEAELDHEYTSHGGQAPAFPAIVAGGANACTLHYVENSSQLKDGDLVLIDAGVEYQYYCSDITRTLPVGKRFSPEQRAIYQAVLNTQLAIIEKVRPGVRWGELQQISERVITEQLLELGLLQGKLEELLAKEAFKPFYMHRFGHWLGMDTHDVGKYAIEESDGAASGYGKSDCEKNGYGKSGANNEENMGNKGSNTGNEKSTWRVLEPNMVLTVEPGIYIPANTANVDEKWWNIGVRIEDDVLVTVAGCEVLTEALPKTVSELEALKQ